MAFQVSPGVQVSEIDLTNVVPAVSSTVGGFAGTFQWGPVDEVVTCLLYTSPSPRDKRQSRMPSSA